MSNRLTGMWDRLDRRRAHRFVSSARPAAAERPRPDLPEGTDTLPQIRHLVILMMENHSFDNYLGTLGRGDGFTLGPDGRPDATNPGEDGRPVRAHQLKGPLQVPRVPTQSWHASHIQWAGGKLDGFPRSVWETVAPPADPTVPMGYWTAEDLPFYASLARTFPLADRWFSSCLGPTFPNRRFLIAGTAHGLIDDQSIELIDYPEAGTIFDHLSHHGISWVNYHDVFSLRRFSRRALGRRGLVATRHLALATFRWFPPLIRALKGDLQLTADLYPLDRARVQSHLRSLERFFADADAGNLPAVSIVDPNFSRFSEENPQDIQIGEGFASAVIDRVMHGPGWPGTVLIWLYDEHGGYYDHVDPPPAPAPDGVEGRSEIFLPAWVRALLRPFFGHYLAELEATDQGDRHYDRLGFRVPAVIVSPYARPDFVTSRVHDHTSILKLIERKWNLPPLTARDAWADDPLEALDLDGPPAFLDPPALAAPARPWNPVRRTSRRRRSPRP